MEEMVSTKAMGRPNTRKSTKVIRIIAVSI